MQRLFTYNIQTKVGSNLNRYTYVLNNPLKYTDPSGYAYYGYGGANTSAGVMQNRCLISQQIEYFETRRSAFLSNQWHGVTLFDMIGDRGGAVSGNYSTPAPVPICYVWVNDYSVDDEQTFTITAKKLFYTDYFKGAALNSFLNNDFTPYYQVAQSGGGAPGWMGDANTGVGAFGLANGAKTELIDYAIRSNYKSAQTWGEFNKLRPTQQAWRTTNTLGKTGATYLKYAKGLGVVGAGVSTAYSITNAGMYYYNGGSDWQVGAKSTLDVIMTGAAFFGPIGFGISATYFILDASTGGFGGFGSTKP